MQLPRRLWMSTFALSVLSATPIVAGYAQEPVTKPVNQPAAAGDRLPAPRNITAVQLPDGRIRVSWSPVVGATSYAIVRSVPPEAPKAITPNVTDTVFIDSDVWAGKTYYYVISALNNEATGMRQGSAPLKATLTAAGAIVVIPSAPTNVVARYDPAVRSIRVTWVGPRDVTFVVEFKRTPIDTSFVNVTRTRNNFLDVSGGPEGLRVQFRVASENAAGTRSAATMSNEVLVDSLAVQPASSGGAMSGATSGTVAVTMGSALSLRVGATISAKPAQSGASAPRWLSLDEGIATVDAAGTVTARSAGRAQILAIGRAADGSVRVTLVAVTVSP
jgi:hypothetical protein